MSVTLNYSADSATSDPQQNPVLIVGQLKNVAKISYDQIRHKLQPRVSEETYLAAVGSLHPLPTDSCPLWLNSATVAALPTKCSRHNAPSRSHALTKIVKSCFSGGDEYVVIVCERSDVFASGCAIARALPVFNGKSTNSNAKRSVTVEFILVGTDSEIPLTESDVECLRVVASSIRLSARIVDAPCSEMHTDIFLDEVRKVGAELKIVPTIIQGEALLEKGLGGIYGVGKAAVNKPALAVLSHTPEGATKSIAWVGKGIVYDTGGLCIKAKTSMLGMKRDCGGAAAILGAFYAAVKLGFKENLHCVLCLAENAVGPEACRPDDILKLYSGRTVEINNTDAEGRLVLGDGVAYALKDLEASIIVDMATLTGAQGVATGRYHASIVTNTESWESVVVQAGQRSGDLTHPLPFSPELHFSEFASAIADMKNSVADRSNCQVSCAGLFIMSHLGFDFPGVWLHVDMAAPAFSGERATGYGVALMTTLFGQASQNSLLQYVAPDVSCNETGAQENCAKKIRLN